MKNYQYLTSDLLEAHLLGLVAGREKQELEHLLATDEDVLSDLSDVELSLEAYFMKNAVPPPPGIREKIELRISQTDLKKWTEPAPQDTPPRSDEFRSPDPHYVHVEVDNTHIRVHKHWKAAFIAVFILSKIFLVLGLYFYFKADSLEKEVTRLKVEAQQTAPPRR